MSPWSKNRHRLKSEKCHHYRKKLKRARKGCSILKSVPVLNFRNSIFEKFTKVKNSSDLKKHHQNHKKPQLNQGSWSNFWRRPNSLLFGWDQEKIKISSPISRSHSLSKDRGWHFFKISGVIFMIESLFNFFVGKLFDIKIKPTFRDCDASFSPDPFHFLRHLFKRKSTPHLYQKPYKKQNNTPTHTPNSFTKVLYHPSIT